MINFTKISTITLIFTESDLRDGLARVLFSNLESCFMLGLNLLARLSGQKTRIHAGKRFLYWMSCLESSLGYLLISLNNKITEYMKKLSFSPHIIKKKHAKN